ncbi:glycosyltransferase [Pedobacter helvus]|uniref:Glycosyltransferase n=1 Tax=Pedobacter helvus TaxID=2563444 RepID=A0ABW9JEC6_9SPHI|nr:glycosyltransferase [Pedobacter ureilyticus]
MKVSVCIATYNGEKYLKEQIGSILNQISLDDELIIVDDCSKDRTIEILEAYNDSRIKIFRNEVNQREVFSFGRALCLANNEIIFMADQDDVWVEGRLELMKNNIIKSESLLLTSNSSFIDGLGRSIDFCIEGVFAKHSVSYNKNILAIFVGKTNYYGCAMAFRKELKEIILPIPNYVESHDLWIAMAGNLLKSNIHIDDKTLLRRIHGNNASIVSRSLKEKIKSRLIFAKSYFDLINRIKNNRSN